MPRKPEYDRDVLIDRARDLFWQNGWAGTSMKDLERVLGLKPGSFYAAFGSKAALFALALDRYAETGAKRLAALEEEFGAFGALQEYPRAVISSPDAKARACMLAKTVLEMGQDADEIGARASKHLATMERRFAELFRAAQSAQQIHASYDANALARRYQSDLLGLRISAERPDTDANAIADDIAESLLRLKTPRADRMV